MNIFLIIMIIFTVLILFILWTMLVAASRADDIIEKEYNQQ